MPTIPGKAVCLRACARAVASALVALVGLGLLAGCKGDPEDALKQDRRALMRRAQVFWTHKCREEFPPTYRFLEPEWRARMTEQEWIRSFGLVRWRNAEVVDAKVHGSQGIIKVRFHYEIMDTIAQGQTGEETATEKWTRVGGEWYKEETPQFQTPDWEGFPGKGA